MQEVDKFEDLNSFLKDLGYEGFFGPRPDNLMGVAIFYNTSTYAVAQDETPKTVSFLNPNGKTAPQVYMVGKFKNRATGKELTVATAHLKAKAPFGAVRVCQSKQLLEALKNEKVYILAGDFNDSPDSECI